MIQSNILSKLRIKEAESLVGKRAGSLTVLGEPFSIRAESGLKVTNVVVQCDCGSVFVRLLSHIRSIWSNKINSSSCKDCLKFKMTKHGETVRNSDGTNNQSRLYMIWVGMRHRCSKPKPGSKMYKKYVQRGIEVCKEWNTFENFRAWSHENGYIEEDKDLIKNKADRLSIDRINPKLGYAPDNCRWVTGRENSANVAVERDRIIDLQEIQLLYYEQLMIDNGINIPDIEEIRKFQDILKLIDMPKPWTPENREKIIKYFDGVLE